MGARFGGHAWRVATALLGASGITLAAGLGARAQAVASAEATVGPPLPAATALKGSSCHDPLEVRHFGEGDRGDVAYISVSVKEVPLITEGASHGETVTYAWRSKSKNVAICPYPSGVTLHMFAYGFIPSLGREGEIDVKKIPEHTTARGGKVTFVVRSSQPDGDFYLSVRGYFIHPPG
jgi:hypothetical protein